MIVHVPVEKAACSSAVPSSPWTALPLPTRGWRSAFRLLMLKTSDAGAMLRLT